MIETKFKETEVGRVPVDWEVKKLGEILSIGNGRDYKHLHHGNVPVYGTGGLMTYVDDYLYEGETVCIGRKGTIDAPQYHAGKIWTVDTLFYTCNFKDINVKFLYYLFTTLPWNSYNEATGVPSLTSKNILRVTASFPPLPEQRRIATTLSNIDSLISNLDTLIEKKRNIKQGAMQQLLTGKTRLEGFSEPWVEKKLGEIGSFSKGLGISRSESNTGTIPAIRYGEIYTSHNDYIKCFYSHISEEVAARSKRLKCGDVLFAGSGETKEDIGKAVAYIADDVAYAGGDIIILSPMEQVISIYLGFLLNTKCIVKQRTSKAQGDAIVHITSKSLSSINISLPPLSEQRVIASILTSMDDEIAKLEQKREKYAAVKQGMMQQLLTGKIRLTD